MSQRLGVLVKMSITPSKILKNKKEGFFKNVGKKSTKLLLTAEMGDQREENLRVQREGIGDQRKTLVIFVTKGKTSLTKKTIILVAFSDPRQEVDAFILVRSARTRVPTLHVDQTLTAG